MGKPIDHANGSVRKWGGVIDDYIAIHEFMDSSKIVLPDNRHRALTHNGWFITVVLPAVFGDSIRNSIGRDVAVIDIGEQHCFEDFKGRFIPTAQDFLQLMPHSDWMSGNGIAPSSVSKFESGKDRGRGIPNGYPLAVQTPLDRGA